jgi:threonine aldolase
MLNFESDYTEGADEKILARLFETNREQVSGYGSDPYCASARAKIREACQSPEADVWFLVGGTQTNQVVIDSLLAGYEGVVCADTGHVNVHEAGAIEATGRKVLALPEHDGKLDAADLAAYLATFFADANAEHMVQPGMVYISHPTEYGTLYTKAELAALAAVCARWHLPLYLDGARLAYGLAARGTDVTLADLARLCTAFYIGGTKTGALCGEAVVFPRHGSPAHFLTTIKRRGALLAKGRLLGIQFDTLFSDGLYEELGRRAIDAAEQLKAVFRSKGYVFYRESPTNQIFLVLENERLKALEQQVRFSFWEKADDTHTVVRCATSWATTQQQVQALAALL